MKEKKSDFYQSFIDLYIILMLLDMTNLLLIQYFIKLFFFNITTKKILDTSYILYLETTSIFGENGSYPEKLNLVQMLILKHKFS